MYHFQAGTGPDTQAIGIALEEMNLDYSLAPGRAPVPVVVFGQARLPGHNNILLALARRMNRFVPNAEAAAPWLSKTPPGLDELDALLGTQDFILGAYTVVDMAMYPIAARADVAAYPNVRAWMERLRVRPAVGRGMGVVAA
jgi:glutathione S-transferase